MKAKLEFDLPEEQEIFEMACKSSDYHSIISGTLNELRTMSKHLDLKDDEHEIVEKIRKIIWDQISYYNLEF